MNKYEKDYRKLLKKVLKKGVSREDRTGVGCISLFDLSLTVKVKDKFPILTGRKMFTNTFNTEFDWFMNGETNIKRFKDNNVKIWDAWADENGDLGPVYGSQMRNWNGVEIDQLTKVIEDLKNNPDSRRHIISLWNPEQLDKMALPPCYLYFQFFVDKNKKLNMFVVQRSGDMFLGIPYDVCLFSKILLYVSQQVNLKANKMTLKIVDAHIYKNQFEAVNEYLDTFIFPLPDFHMDCVTSKIYLEDYRHGPKITVQVAV